MARVWLRQSQGCPLTLAGAEPDKPSSPPQDCPPLLISTPHRLPPFSHFHSLFLSHLFYSSPPLSSVLPWAPVPNLQGDYDKNERPPRDGANRDKRERSGWQRERTRRRGKGLEKDDVTGNSGCALRFGLRLSEPAIYISPHLSSIKYQVYLDRIPANLLQKLKQY